MTEIDTADNHNNSTEGLRVEQNKDENQVQINENHEFMTQDQTPQIDDNNNQEDQKSQQSNTEEHPLDSIIQNGFNSLNPIEATNSASSTSTKSESPKQKQLPKTQDKKKAKQNKEESNNYTEEELDEYILSIVNKRTPPPREMRNPILQLLNRRRVQALVDGDYEYAEEQDNTIKAFNRVVQSEDNKNNENEQFEILFSRYQQLQKDYQDITDKWDDKINKYNEEEEKHYKELIQKQEKEKEIYHKNWADPEYLRPFTKPSPKLNSMREQERAMAVARMYQQAKVMKQSADKLQKEETAAAQQRISRTMEIEWNRMMERHENERKKFVDHKNRNVSFLESEKQKDLKPTLNALNQIKSKKGLLLSTKQSSATIAKTAQDIEAQSPRTHKKYTDFKSEKKKPKLAIKPVNDQQLQSTKRSTKTKSKSQKNQSKKQNESQQKQNESETNQTNDKSDNDTQQIENQENSIENDQNENLEENINNNKEDENKKEENFDENFDENKNEEEENKNENEKNIKDDQNKNEEEETKKEENNEINKDDENAIENGENNSPGILEKMSSALRGLTKDEEKTDENKDGDADAKENLETNPESPK